MRGPIGLGTAVLVAIVGCGGGGSTPSSSAGTPASPSAISPASPAAGAPSLPPILSNHFDPELEAMLPAEAAGTALQRYSVALYDLQDPDGDHSAIDAFLQSIGKSPSDATFAAALDPSAKLTGGVSAIKVTGADPASLLAAMVSVEQSNLGGRATVRQGTLGGKNVTSLSVASEATGLDETEWLYGRGDVVFIVHADDEARAVAFLEALP
jgi:hypothetical protein